MTCTDPTLSPSSGDRAFHAPWMPPLPCVSPEDEHGSWKGMMSQVHQGMLGTEPRSENHMSSVLEESEHSATPLQSTPACLRPHHLLRSRPSLHCSSSQTSWSLHVSGQVAHPRHLLRWLHRGEHSPLQAAFHTISPKWKVSVLRAPLCWPVLGLSESSCVVVSVSSGDSVGHGEQQREKERKRRSPPLCSLDTGKLRLIDLHA